MKFIIVAVSATFLALSVTVAVGQTITPTPSTGIYSIGHAALSVVAWGTYDDITPNRIIDNAQSLSTDCTRMRRARFGQMMRDTVMGIGLQSSPAQKAANKICRAVTAARQIAERVPY